MFIAKLTTRDLVLLRPIPVLSYYFMDGRRGQIEGVKRLKFYEPHYFLVIHSW